MRKKFNIFLVFMMMLFTIPFGVYDVSAEDSVNENEDSGQVTDTDTSGAGESSDGSDNSGSGDSSEENTGSGAENTSGENDGSGSGTSSGENSDSKDGNTSGENSGSEDENTSAEKGGSEDSSPKKKDPNKETEEEYEPAEDKRVVGKLVTEAEADQVYTMNFKTESRATSSQLENPVKVLVVGDKQYLQIKVNDRGANFFRSLKFDGEEVTWNNIDKAPYIIQHELKNGIDSEISVEMVIDTGDKVMPHADIKLWLTDTDPDAVEEINEEEKKGLKELEETKLVPDKAYNINYTILESNGKGTSVADTFFEKPGTLLVKDDKTYFQFTVTSASMIKSLSNKYGEALVVAEDKDKDKKVLQLRVNNDLSDMKLDMFISVPGLYSAPHVAILSFDKDSKKEIPVKGLAILVPPKDSGKPGGPPKKDIKDEKDVQEGKSDNNNKQPEKPELGETASKDSKAASTDNPKTGDTSQILFFSSLLLLSLVVLVVQVRRRLAA